VVASDSGGSVTLALYVGGVRPYISDNEINQGMTTYHFTIDLKSGDGGRPAKVEWTAGSQEVAERIVTEMYGEDFDITYHYAS